MFYFPHARDGSWWGGPGPAVPHLAPILQPCPQAPLFWGRVRRGCNIPGEWGRISPCAAPSTGPVPDLGGPRSPWPGAVHTGSPGGSVGLSPCTGTCAVPEPAAATAPTGAAAWGAPRVSHSPLPQVWGAAAAPCSFWGLVRGCEPQGCPGSSVGAHGGARCVLGCTGGAPRAPAVCAASPSLALAPLCCSAWCVPYVPGEPMCAALHSVCLL